MTAEALVAHFKAVADASPVPVLLYNLPAVTGIILTPAIVAALVEHPNITGIKETSPDLERLGQFTTIRPEKFDVFCGWAPVVFAALGLGAAGAILAVANVVPDECVELFDCVREGRLDEALALQRRLTPLAQLVTATYGIAGLKKAMSLVGYQGGPVRAPLLPLASKGVRRDPGRFGAPAASALSAAFLNRFPCVPSDDPSSAPRARALAGVSRGGRRARGAAAIPPRSRAARDDGRDSRAAHAGVPGG